jgi:hypothetical protein
MGSTPLFDGELTEIAKPGIHPQGSEAPHLWNSMNGLSDP